LIGFRALVLLTPFLIRLFDDENYPIIDMEVGSSCSGRGILKVVELSLRQVSLSIGEIIFNDFSVGTSKGYF